MVVFHNFKHMNHIYDMFHCYLLGVLFKFTIKFLKKSIVKVLTYFFYDYEL
jgi:hypothetical protein